MATRISKTTEAIGQLYQADRMRARAEVLHRIGDPLAAVHERSDAGKIEAAAEAVLTMPETARPSSNGGEMALYDYPDPDDRYVGLHLLDTLRNPDMMAAQASLERHKLLLELGCVELGQDLAATIEPTNSLERMLCGQLASVHYLALRFLALSQTTAMKAAEPGQQYWREQTVEACRLTNAATRLLSSFNEGTLTLHKLRNAGQQVVHVVQHVQVDSGAQAVVAGQVTPGGSNATGGLPKNEGTMPCDASSSTPMPPRAASRKPVKKRPASKPQSVVNGAVACTGDTSPARPEATNAP